MKRIIFLFLAFTIILMTCNAQNMKWGITTGVNLSSQTNQNIRTGFQLGINRIIELPCIENGVFLNLGALISSKGYISKWNYSEELHKNMQWKGRIYYLDIPAHFGYKYTLNDKISFFASSGLYLGIGLNGETIVISKGDNQNKITEVFSNNVFGDDLYKSVDWGVGVKIGTYLFQHIEIAAGYDWGIRNLKTSDDFINIRNKNLYFSCSYFF